MVEKQFKKVKFYVENEMTQATEQSTQTQGKRSKK